jgi:hypothetical protein
MILFEAEFYILFSYQQHINLKIKFYIDPELILLIKNN